MTDFTSVSCSSETTKGRGVKEDGKGERGGLSHGSREINEVFHDSRKFSEGFHVSRKINAGWNESRAVCTICNDLWGSLQNLVGGLRGVVSLSAGPEKYSGGVQGAKPPETSEI